MGDRVGYITRSHLGGSYADFTVVQDSLVTRLPDSISTQQAAAVLLQGLTALSQATVAVSNEIQPGVCAAQQQQQQQLCQLCFEHHGAAVEAPWGHDWPSTETTSRVPQSLLYITADCLHSCFWCRAHKTGGPDKLC